MKSDAMISVSPCVRIVVIFIGKVVFRWDSEATRIPATCLAVSTAFLLAFTYAASFNIQVRELLLGGITGSASAHLLMPVVILVLGLLLMAVFVRRDWLNIVKILYPIATGSIIFLFAYKWFAGTYKFFMQADNPITIIGLMLACVIFVGTSIVLAITLPRSNSD